MSIELKNASFEYEGGYRANDKLNLLINEGERVAIVGQNGAGKTTAVKMMNGLHKPCEGDVIIDGVNTKDKTAAQIARTVGYVFQNPDDQIFNQSVQAEIEYMPRYFKMSEDEIKRRSSKAIKLCDLERYLDTNPFDIPYQIRKFITIAAIIATEPKYVILDEPTAGQDQRGIRILEDIMTELGREGIGVITISHDMEFVANNFERVIAMAHKNIIADGAVRDIFGDNKIIEESRICKPQIGQIAEAAHIEKSVIYCDELVKEIS